MTITTKKMPAKRDAAPTSVGAADGSIVTPPLEDMYPFLDRDELAGNILDPNLQRKP